MKDTLLEIYMSHQNSILLVANWDSNVGYAWWLMESFWVKISEEFSISHRSIICYPSISSIPAHILSCPADKVQFDFNKKGITSLIKRIKFLKNNRVKYIYLTDAPPLRMAYLLYRLTGVQKIITHDHTPGVRTQPKGLKKLIKQLINSLPFLTADACFGATEFVKDRLINVNCIPRKKCFAISNGIFISKSKPEIDIRSELHLSNNAFVVVTASRAHNYKGIIFAMDVIFRAKQISPNNSIIYIFIGDGPHLEDFKNYAIKLDIQDKIKFTGRIANVNQLISKANCAFHPSYGEVGYSLSILEYMQAGLPLLVSDNPSVCGATKNGVTGLIYTEHNIEDAANKLLMMSTHPDLMKEMSIESRNVVQSDFSLDKTHQALINSINVIFNLNR